MTSFQQSATGPVNKFFLVSGPAGDKPALVIGNSAVKYEVKDNSDHSGAYSLLKAPLNHIQNCKQEQTTANRRQLNVNKQGQRPR